MKPLLTSLLLIHGALSVHAQLNGTDDFNDNSKDTSKWGTDAVSGGASLVEANARLEYRVSTPDTINSFDEALRPWVLNTAGNNDAFDVVLDVTNTVNSGGPTWTSTAGGFSHTLAIKSDGTLWAWGKNSGGQLGDGTTTRRTSPVQVGSATTWTKVAAGENHSVGLRSNGTLWAWGSNFSGQLGDGTTTTRTSPVQIGTATTWTQVVAGSFHTVAIRSDGTLWAWGSNADGQLGDGTTTHRTSPVQIGSATTWAKVAAGIGHTVALRTNGTVWAWGDNADGQLGDGTTTPRTTPVQIGSATNWVHVSAGESQTVALKSDGTLWAWGNNFYGQLGDGTTTNRTSPVQIGSATNWASAATGLGHSAGVRTDGTLWTWGLNFNGQLGDGTTTNRTSPAQANAETNWSLASAGGNHTATMKTNGTLWTWGRNSDGQIGDGTLTQRNSPFQVSAGSGGSGAGNASIGLTVTSLQNAQDSLYVELYRNSGGGNGFLAALKSNAFGGDEVLPYTTPTNHLGVTTGCVRVSYNPTTKIFTTYYDTTGRGDGFQWQEYGSFGVGASGGGNMRNSPWQLTLNQGFEVSVSGFSEGLVVSSGQLHADNFQAATGLAGWRLAAFGSATASGNTADDADPDNDGVVNLLEYATGQNPASSSTLNTPLAPASGGNIAFFYARSVAAVAAGTGFVVEWSDTLPGTPWSIVGVTHEVLSDNGTLQQMNATLPAGTGGKRFVRLRVTAPPP
jgi:alpha-tubulin suppressor-like RCC1 family protein